MSAEYDLNFILHQAAAIVIDMVPLFKWLAAIVQLDKLVFFDFSLYCSKYGGEDTNLLGGCS